MHPSPPRRDLPPPPDASPPPYPAARIGGAPVVPETGPAPAPSVPRFAIGVAVGVALSVVVFAVATAVVAGTGTSPPGASALGDPRDLPVANVAEALTTGEAQFRNDVTARGGRAIEPAHCWLSYPDRAATGPASRLRCGPVLFPAGGGRPMWLAYTLGLRAESDERGRPVRAVLTVHPVADLGFLDGGEDLRRPDGLAAPTALTDAAGTTVSDHMSVEAADLGLSGTALPADAYLVGLRYRLVLERWGLVDRLPLGGIPQKAPEGQRLLGVELAWQDPHRSGELVAVSGAVTFSLEVDGVRRALPTLIAPNTVGAPVRRTLVVAVADTAQSFRLVATEPEAAQTIDVNTGIRGGSVPAVLYRPTTNGTAAATGVLDFDHTGIPDDGTGRVTVTVTGASLSWTFGTANRQASGLDRAFLSLQFSTSESGHRSGTPAPTDRLLLRLPNGQTVPAQREASLQQAITGGRLAWEVPADFTTGTVVIAPGRIVSGDINGNPMVDDYHDGQLEIPVSIPAS